VENDPFFIERQAEWDFPPTNVCDAVSQSIARSVASIQGKAIVAFSESGYTGRMVARYRPRVPILVVTPHKETFNQSLVIYGCEPVLIKSVKNLADAQKIAKKILLERGVAKSGDAFVLGAGIPFGTPGATNMMVVERV
jgi:pyruvate kinase